jgi:hypothetical protein
MKISSDPLDRVCPELFDLIFQHLSVKELLDYSCVSRVWHEEIGTSRQIKNVKVYIFEQTRDELRDALDKLMKSERDYRDIAINLNLNQFDDDLKVGAKKQFQNVHYTDGEINKSLWPIESIAMSVKTLALSHIKCDTFFDVNLHFPHLRHLSLCGNSINVNILFKKCANLNSFDYCDKNTCKTGSSLFLYDIMKNNAKLKSVTLNIDNIDSDFIPLVNDFEFQLNEFSFRAKYEKRLRRMPPNNQLLLIEFLTHQQKHLKELQIDQWCGLNAFAKIFSMRQLEKLTCNLQHGNENFTNIIFSTNTTIQSLHISEMPTANSSILFRKTLQALPKLSKLKTSVIKTNDLLIIEVNCRQLKELYVEDFHVSILPHAECFSSLNTFKSMDVEVDLLKWIKSKDKKYRRHFEKLILSAANWEDVMER